MQDQIFDETTREDFPQDFQQPESKFKKFIKNKKVWAGTGILVLILAGVSWFILTRPKPGIKEESNSVVLQIKGPEELASGNETEYKIVMRNGENADMVGVSLDLIYPSNFKFKSASVNPSSSTGQKFSLPKLNSGESSEISISAKLSGSPSEVKEIKARLHYKLSNFNSGFEQESSIKTMILAPNMTLDVVGPAETVAGQDTTFAFKIFNVSDHAFENVAVSAVFPPGFIFSSSNPPATRPNLWVVGKLLTGSSAMVEVTGSFTGDVGSERIVKADLGIMVNNSLVPQITASGNFKLSKPPLSLKVTAEPSSVVNLGETVSYELTYENQGTIGLTNMVVTVALIGPAFDLTRLSVRDGIVVGNTLSWKAATLSNLSLVSPNEKGDINFTVTLKNSPVSNIKNQELKVTTLVTADQLPKPIRSADVSLKLASKLAISATGDYISGAVPMIVGKPTLFAVTLLLTNLSNDLTNTEVIASMPLAASSWKNVVIPDSEKSKVSFDTNSGKIRWKTGDLPAYTGKYSPAARVTIQIEVNPTEADRGRTMNLLSNIQASGHDGFINQDIKSESISQFTTSEINDDVFDSSSTTVQ